MLRLSSMLEKIVIATAVLLSACFEDGVGGQAGSHPTEESPEDEPVITQLARQPDPEEGKSVCEMLPPGDGACAHACDADALLAFIPPGTCVTFVCTLLDGSEYVTGGCNW